MAKPWSEEEMNYLEDNWGVVSIKGIAKKLNRSIIAIKLKAQRTGLDDARMHYDGITLNQLSYALNISYSTLKNWVKLYEFPVKKKTFAIESRVLVVGYNDFWKWAEANRNMIDFSKVEKYAIGPEPAWVDVKRKADVIKNRHTPKSLKEPWSESEDKRLRWMLAQHKYTYPELSNDLKRSQGSIKKRICDLGITDKPVRLNNHIPYTEDDIKTAIRMLHEGYCFEEISTRLNRSASGVRGKMERMGYKFRNGVPYKEDVS